MGNTVIPRISSDSETQNNFPYEESDFSREPRLSRNFPPRSLSVPGFVNRDRITDVIPGLPQIRDREVVSQMARLSLDPIGFQGRGFVFQKSFLTIKVGRFFYLYTGKGHFSV